MGLDTSHDAFHGGYGSYLILRQSLMAAAGYRQTKEYPPTYEWDGDPDFDLPGNKTLWDRAAMGEVDLDEWPFDPVLYLWAHQDCDGVIPPAMAGRIAERIEELLPKLNDATLTFAPAWGVESPTGRSTTSMAIQFAKGLRTASDAGEEVVFA